MSSTWPLDARLLTRFRSAGSQIAWRPGPSGSARIARLDDEEARVEVRAAGRLWLVESGPVGALVVLLEADRRQAAPRLGTVAGGDEPGFPGGAITAAWEDGAPAASGALPLRDVVELARFALR